MQGNGRIENELNLQIRKQMDGHTFKSIPAMMVLIFPLLVGIFEFVLYLFVSRCCSVSQSKHALGKVLLWIWSADCFAYSTCHSLKESYISSAYDYQAYTVIWSIFLPLLYLHQFFVFYPPLKLVCHQHHHKAISDYSFCCKFNTVLRWEF